MEKLVVDKGPPNSIDDYSTLKCPDKVFPTSVEDAGAGFIAGTTIGCFYNFIKGNSCGFKSRLGSALAKSPCIGANLALVSLGYSLSRAAYFKYSGETPHGYIIPYEIPCSFIAGAVGFARHGLRPALLGALVSTGLWTLPTMDNLRKTRYRSSICKTNTYTYPYYRPTQDDDIHWPEALWSQDNSKMSIPWDDGDISWPEASWIDDDSSLIAGTLESINHDH